MKAILPIKVVLLPVFGLAAVLLPGRLASAEDFYAKLTTVDGRTYDRVTVKKVEPDGLGIEYMPGSGGIGMAKVKFRSLPDALQQKYGYDAQRATAFESAKAREQEQRLANMAAEEAVVASNTLVLDQILADYSKTNPYAGGGRFLDADRAFEVWDLVTAKGLRAKLEIGNVRENVTSPADIDHAWVMAEVSPGNWLALETVAGKVVYRQQNDRYYSGYSFLTPNELNACLKLVSEYRAAAARRQEAVDSYSQATAQANAAGGYAPSGSREGLDRAAADANQRAADLDQLGGKLTPLLRRDK